MIKIFLILHFCVSFLISCTLAGDFNKFMRCKGKPSGLGNYFTDNPTLIGTCLTQGRKYCQFACMLFNAGVADEETGDIDFQKIKSINKRYSTLDKETSEKLVEEMGKCTRGKNIKYSKSCEEMRKVYYCIHNAYIKLCLPDEKPKDINKISAEEGLVKTALTNVEVEDFV